MSNELDIEFIIELYGRNVIPAELLWKTLRLVNDVVYSTEMADLNKIGSEFSEIPQVALDAARYRIKENSGKAFLIETTSSGSLIISGIVAALAYFILKQTIGETLKESWLESNLHKKLKSFFLKKRFAKCDEVSKNISSNIRKKLPYISEGLWYEIKLTDERALIIIKLDVSKVLVPPPRREILNSAKEEVEEEEEENKEMGEERE